MVGPSMRPQFNEDYLKQVTANAVAHVESVVIAQLSRIGLKVVTNARTKGAGAGGGFYDRTGNLRSSIGYAVIKDGAILDAYSKFEGQAAAVARRAVAEAQVTDSVGFGLIVVAGMEYATYVEAKGKDVISGSCLEIQTMLQEAQIQLENL